MSVPPLPGYRTPESADRTSGPHPEEAERGDGAEEALEAEAADFLHLELPLEDARHAGGDEDLAALGLPAQARGEIGHGADGAIVPAALEPDGADRRVALGDPDAE